MARVLVSPHQRCLETAALVLRGARLAGLGTVLPVVRVPGLAERRLGPQPTVDQRLGWDLAPPEGESNRAVALRVLRALREAGPAPALIVSHAGPLRVLLGLLQRRPTRGIGAIKIPLCTPSWQTLTPERLHELERWCTSGPGPEPP